MDRIPALPGPTCSPGAGDEAPVTFSRSVGGELAGSNPVETDSGHLVALPGTEWKAWRHALLRTTGFPVDGLDLLCAQAAAQLADAFLLGSASREEFDRAYAAAEAHNSEAVRFIAADPLFREAIAWQNPAVLTALDGLARVAPGRPANRRQRQRERTVARYWQRYCAKTETIGFFGPVCWVTLDPDVPGVRLVPGANLLRERRVYLEHWAIAQYADVIAGSLQARRWLAPMLQPHLVVRDGKILQPARPSVALARPELAVLSRMDGRRPALEIAADVVADPWSGLRKAEDVYLLLERMVDRGLIRWDFNLPVHRDCERFLRERIAMIGDADVRSPAEAGLNRLSRAREEVAASAGDPDRLPQAISQLEAEFTAVSDNSAERRAGQMYAGRRIYWEEASRDLKVAFGKPVLKAIAGPLAVVAQAARWLTAALADEYLRALRDLYVDLSDELGSAEVPLGQLWFLSQGLFYGSAERPADRVAVEFTRRWADLFAARSAVEPDGVVQFTSAELLARVSQIFPAERPGWPDARIHSPDLQIRAESVDAIERGDFSVVLGELHTAWATNSCAGAVAVFDDPGELAADLAVDLGVGRIQPLLPTDWPRNTPRLAYALGDESDVQLGILAAPGADPDRLLPISAASVSEVGGRLTASAGDGRSWPLTAVFARLLSEVSVEVFKQADTGPHTARMVIDRLTIARETWRSTVRECGLTEAGASAEMFLAARRWRLALGLPEQVFVKLDTEVKPFFVDFRSPLYVTSLLHMLRAAEVQGGGDVMVCVTEMLPTPQEAWVADADGRRYLSELRLHIRDPARPSGWAR
jgi:Lantibiotic dehydratase, N terminus